MQLCSAGIGIAKCRIDRAIYTSFLSAHIPFRPSLSTFALARLPVCVTPQLLYFSFSSSRSPALCLSFPPLLPLSLNLYFYIGSLSLVKKGKSGGRVEMGRARRFVGQTDWLFFPRICGVCIRPRKRVEEIAGYEGGVDSREDRRTIPENGSVLCRSPDVSVGRRGRLQRFRVYARRSATLRILSFDCRYTIVLRSELRARATRHVQS